MSALLATKLRATAKHIRAVGEYRNLLVDADHLDEAAKALDTPAGPAKESAMTACSAVRAVRAVNGGTCEPSEYRWCSPCGGLLKDMDPCFKLSAAQAQVDPGDGNDATSQAGRKPAAADSRVSDLLSGVAEANARWIAAKDALKAQQITLDKVLAELSAAQAQNAILRDHSTRKRFVQTRARAEKAEAELAEWKRPCEEAKFYLPGLRNSMHESVFEDTDRYVLESVYRKLAAQLRGAQHENKRLTTMIDVLRLEPAATSASPEQAAPVVSVTRADIAGAVGRGWGHPDNRAKTMDAELAFAIVDEICVLAGVRVLP